MCVHTFLALCVYMCECICMCMCVHAGGPCQDVFLSHSYFFKMLGTKLKSSRKVARALSRWAISLATPDPQPYFLQTGFLTEPVAHWLGWPGWPSSPRDTVVPASPVLGLQVFSITPSFDVRVRIQTQVLFAWQAFTTWAISLAYRWGKCSAEKSTCQTEVTWWWWVTQLGLQPTQSGSTNLCS